MRFLRPLVLVGLSALCWACARDSAGSELDPLDPLDTLQVLGTPLATSQRLVSRTKLVWIPGSELIAFKTASDDECAVKTLDVGTGAVDVVDGECALSFMDMWPCCGRLAAAPDGTALYYTVGVGGPTSQRWPLRVAHRTGDSITTLRDSVPYNTTIAVSPNGRLLAWVAGRDYEGGNDFVVVRDLLSESETQYAVAEGQGKVITFSPDATELLYDVRENFSTVDILHRLALADGIDRVVPTRPHYAQLFRWGSSGIEVLAEVFPTSGSVISSEYRVLNLMTGGSVQVGEIQRDYDGSFQQPARLYSAWSNDGGQVAYWISSVWYEWGVGRWALFVADTRTGNRVRVALGTSCGPTVFSPDGRRVVYFRGPVGDSDTGTFYVVDVPDLSP